MSDKICGQTAAFRYTWPGYDETFICSTHSSKLRRIADALEMHLQLISLDPTVERDRQVCQQKVE